MNSLRLTALGAIAFAIVGCAEPSEEKVLSGNAKLLVGQWEVIKADDEANVGTVIEYSKDGKLKMVAKEEGRDVTVNGNYKVEGDKILLTVRIGGKEKRKNPSVIEKLTETELVVVNSVGKRIEFKRLK